MIHTVQFAFKPSLTAAKIAELGAAFLSLKDKCLDPDTKRPYILSLTGGRDNSPEGLQVFFFHFRLSRDTPLTRAIHFSSVESCFDLFSIKNERQQGCLPANMRDRTRVSHSSEQLGQD